MLGGVFVGGSFLFGQAIHWFMTPLQHLGATQARVAAVGVQAAVGLLAAVVALVRARRTSAADDARLPV